MKRYTQPKLPRSCKKSGPNVDTRPHNRTTILTTTTKTYEKVVGLRPGEELLVEFVNDIVSSAKGGNSVIHHAIRRVGLLRRQLHGGFRRVKIRSEQGRCLDCLIMSIRTFEDDACSAQAVIRKCA